jgi:hypothetical protein
MNDPTLVIQHKHLAVISAIVLIFVFIVMVTTAIMKDMQLSESAKINLNYFMSFAMIIVGAMAATNIYRAYYLYSRT